MKLELSKHISQIILKRANKLRYTVKDFAPNQFNDLLIPSGLVIWSGASEGTIFTEKRVNWAFRALHDTLHKLTRIGFSPLEEIELGRIQANQFDGIVSELVYCEVAGQAKYYLENNKFVDDQVTFADNWLRGITK